MSEYFKSLSEEAKVGMCGLGINNDPYLPQNDDKLTKWSPHILECLAGIQFFRFIPAIHEKKTKSFMFSMSVCAIYSIATDKHIIFANQQACRTTWFSRRTATSKRCKVTLLFYNQDHPQFTPASWTSTNTHLTHLDLLYLQLDAMLIAIYPTFNLHTI